MSGIYRKSSLERISSPEQLDRMISVANVSSWLVMVGFVFIISIFAIWLFTGKVSKEINILGVYMNTGEIETVFSPVEGNIDQILVRKDEKIREGDILAVAEGNLIRSNYSGTIHKININKGKIIEKGKEIAEIRIQDKVNAVRSFVGLSEAKKMHEGMPVILIPSTVNESQTGHMSGYIESIGGSGATEDEMYRSLGDEQLVRLFRNTTEPVMEVLIRINQDVNTKSGYAWSNKNGENIVLTEFTMISVRVILNTQAPIEMMIGEID